MLCIESEMALEMDSMAKADNVLNCFFVANWLVELAVISIMIWIAILIDISISIAI